MILLLALLALPWGATIRGDDETGDAVLALVWTKHEILETVENVGQKGDVIFVSLLKDPKGESRLVFARLGISSTKKTENGAVSLSFHWIAPPKRKAGHANLTYDAASGQGKDAEGNIWTAPPESVIKTMIYKKGGG